MKITEPAPLTPEQLAAIAAHEQAVAARDAAHSAYIKAAVAADKAGYAASDAYSRRKYLEEYAGFVARANQQGATLVISESGRVAYLTGLTPRRRDGVELGYDGRSHGFTAYKQDDPGVWGSRPSGGILWHEVTE